MGFELVVRAAWSPDGRVVAPARWRVDGGLTTSLERADEADDVVDGVLLPGLVNAHSHHDLGGMAPAASTGSFSDWLLSIGATRGAERDVEAAALVEAVALRRRGVVASGDIDASAGAASRARRRAGLGGRSYVEVVGVHRARALVQLERALEVARALGDEGGLSPHAPYSVHVDALPDVVAASRHRRLPLAMHVAETEDETRFLQHGDGPFAAFLDVIGKGHPFPRPPRMRPVEYVDAHGLLAAGCVVVHGNDLDDDDVARLAAHATPVVYCHGTHRHFDRPPHRLLDLLAAGVPVALGTDSSASNDGVDLWNELRRLVVDRPDVRPDVALRCATVGGRVALRMPLGPATFESGDDAAGVVVGPAPDGVERLDATDLAAWALTGDADVALTCRGDEVVAAPDVALAGASAFLDTVRVDG